LQSGVLWPCLFASALLRRAAHHDCVSQITPPRNHFAGSPVQPLSSVPLDTLPIWGYFDFILMADDQSMEDSKPVSFSDAARFLGVDVFTFYSMVQRKEVPSFLGPSGEFVVSQADLDKLIAKADAPC
jgi:hypothetical protein